MNLTILEKSEELLQAEKARFFGCSVRNAEIASIPKSAEKTAECTITCNMYQNEILLCLHKVRK